MSCTAWPGDKVIELSTRMTKKRRNCVAYLLEDGSLFRANRPKPVAGQELYVSGCTALWGRCRMWAQHKPLQSASFAGNTGTLLTDQVKSL